MCYCDEYDFTINRSDEFMVMKKDENKWFEIDPESLVKLIKKSHELGLLNITNQIDNIFKFEYFDNDKFEKRDQLIDLKIEKIKSYKDDYERWLIEKVDWCYNLETFKRYNDRCLNFKRCKSGIMMGNCGSCCEWEPNKL